MSVPSSTYPTRAQSAPKLEGLSWGTPSLNYRFDSAVVAGGLDGGGSPFQDVDADVYIMVDANVMYTSPGRDWTANLWVKNLTDELVWAGSFSVSTSRAIGGTLMPPRTYGATFGYRF